MFTVHRLNMKLCLQLCFSVCILTVVHTHMEITLSYNITCTCSCSPHNAEDFTTKMKRTEVHNPRQLTILHTHV